MCTVSDVCLTTTDNATPTSWITRHCRLESLRQLVCKQLVYPNTTDMDMSTDLYDVSTTVTRWSKTLGADAQGGWREDLGR